MAITAAMVKELREKTGAGMMDCKKALTATNGDAKAAIDWLREKGISKAEKKASRIAAEGAVAAYITEDAKVGVLVEINCETDFAAGNEKFKALEAKMREIVDANIPVETRYVSYEEALALFENTNQPDTYRLINHTSRPKILINTIGSYSDLYIQPLLDSTGILTVFELRPYGDGFLLRFPPTAHSDRLSVFDVRAQKRPSTLGDLIGFVFADVATPDDMCTRVT